MANLNKKNQITATKQMTVKDLKAECKALGITGYSKLKKDELIKAIDDFKACSELLDNVMESHARPTIPGDGMMICSFGYAAAIASGIRVITEAEYKYFCDHITLCDSLSDAYADAKLRKIIIKIPSVFQIRHEGCKGIVVKFPLEFVDGLKDKDLIITDSARKFASSDWEESPLEICNYLKKKDNWVALNPQFIQSLKWDNPNALIPIIDYWFEKLEATVDDIALAQEFHGILSSVDEDKADTNSNLVAVLQNSSDLIDDFQVVNWRKRQYEKFVNEMKVGRILVPGEYTYMVCDPMYMLNDIYGLDLPALKSGEYWFNNHEGKVAAFRSPLIAPFEAQKLDCIRRDDYWFYQDIIVFNAEDCRWEDMGGADFDGDTCAVIPDSTDMGKIIVDGVRDMDYVVWEPALSAVKEEFSWENLAKFNAKVAKTDRTGIITNYASRAMDIANHLESCIYFAKTMGCEAIYMFHPQEVENDNKIPASVKEMDGHKYLYIRGFVHAVEDKEGNIAYESNGIHGLKTFDEIHEIAESFLRKVEYLRLMQGREIDSAKTGVAAEGMSGLDFVDSVKVEFTPQSMITRTEFLGRPVSGFARTNEYQSLSPLSRVHDYVCRKELDLFDRLGNGCDKIALLVKLLSNEEREGVNKIITLQDGSKMTLKDFVSLRKAEYGKKMQVLIASDIEAEEFKLAMTGLKESEVDYLYRLAESVKVSPETMAAVAYIVTYNKNKNNNKGLSYGWLLFNELLSVFTRNNKRFELYRMPKNAIEASIVDGYIYVNDRKYSPISDVDDCDYVPVRNINGKPYALIHKRSEVVKDIEVEAVSPDVVHVIDLIYGFKYGALENKDNFKRALVNNDYTFRIDLDENSRLCVFVDGESIGTIKTTTGDIDFYKLVGHLVKVTTSPDYKETENTIGNLAVKVIDL